VGGDRQEYTTTMGLEFMFSLFRDFHKECIIFLPVYLSITAKKGRPDQGSRFGR
jgi:hypothetical protein